MRTVTYDAAACAQAKHTNSKLFTDSICVCLTQSAQRSKARKLRHIMQLEDEVASLQRITQQQALHSRKTSAALGTSDRKLAMCCGKERCRLLILTCVPQSLLFA